MSRYTDAPPATASVPHASPDAIAVGDSVWVPVIVTVGLPHCSAVAIDVGMRSAPAATAGVPHVSPLGMPAGSLLVLALAYGGFRWGEATAVTTRRLDLLRSRIHVVEAIATVGAELHLGPTKTYQTRWVTIPTQVRDRLAGHLATLEGELVWCDSRGGPLRHSNWHRRVWLPTTKQVGLEGVRIHDLRHTCAALLIGQGVHPLAVSRHLGHASIAITMDRYGHLFPETDEVVSRALSAAFDGATADLPRPPRGLRPGVESTGAVRMVP